jgi:hypothetical protein
MGRDETKEGSPLFTSETVRVCVRCEPDIIQGSRDFGVSEAYCAVIHLPFVPIGAGRLPFAANIKVETLLRNVDGF